MTKQALRRTRQARRRTRRIDKGHMATVRETAQTFGVSDGLVYDALRNGKVPASRIGRRWLISRQWIERVISGEEFVAF